MPNDFDDRFLKPTPAMKQKPVVRHGKAVNKRSHLVIGWLFVLLCVGVTLAFVGALLTLAWRLALGG